MFYNDEIVFLEVELKYCERCGGLHVRRSNSEAKFCVPCMDAERAVMEQVFGRIGKRSRIENWLDSLAGLVAKDDSGVTELKGGRA